MNMLKLLPLELKRLLQSRFTWLVIALTAFSPVLELILYKPASATTMLSIYLRIQPSPAAQQEGSSSAC